MRKLATLIFLLFVLSLCSACADSADYGRLVTEYNNLVDKHNALVSQYNTLHASHNDLIDKHNTLVSQYNTLHASHNDLTDIHNTLVSQYNTLHASHNDLVDKHNKLTAEFKQYSEEAIVPPYLLVENRKVNLVFRNLDDEIEHWYWEVDALEASIIMGQFMREVDISDLNYLGLRDIAKRFTTRSKYIQLKGHGKSLDFRPYIMKDNFEPIASEFFSQHPDDESKIKEVWNMVTQLNTYSKDIAETPRLPLETLLLGGGDCEDLAILTASVLKAMPAKWDVSLVYMDSDNPADFNELNHITVYVDTGEYKTFVESTQGKIMSPWEHVDGFYLEVQ